MHLGTPACGLVSGQAIQGLLCTSMEDFWWDFNSADLEHALKYRVSCTAFRMGMPILVLIVASRVPTEACSLSELCVSVSHFSLVEGL